MLVELVILVLVIPQEKVMDVLMVPMDEATEVLIITHRVTGIILARVTPIPAIVGIFHIRYSHSRSTLFLAIVSV